MTPTPEITTSTVTHKSDTFLAFAVTRTQAESRSLSESTHETAHCLANPTPFAVENNKIESMPLAIGTPYCTQRTPCDWSIVKVRTVEHGKMFKEHNIVSTKH